LLAKSTDMMRSCVNRAALSGSNPRRADAVGRAVTLRGHQTGELGGVNLANIAEMFGYSDDPLSMFYQQLTGASMTCCEMRLDFVRYEALVMR
jgi:hypothetical protein